MTRDRDGGSDGGYRSPPVVFGPAVGIFLFGVSRYLLSNNPLC
jgi:hypothetical protein